MNILFIAAECAPYVKVGGLGDVVGTLPLALQKLRHSVRVVVPHYGSIDDEAHGIRPFDEFSFRWNGSLTRTEVSTTERDGVAFYFIRGWPYFANNIIYNNDEGIDIGRFLYLAAATFQLLLRLASRSHWRPDILHVHDWHTALVPYLLECQYRSNETLGRAATVFSIHNMQYQGWGCDWHLARAGLPPINHPLLAAMGIHNNSLAVGLAYSTALSTVSPTYAQEIATPAAGFGLDGLVHTRSARLTGVLNGIDVARWNPSTSTALAATYDSESLENRARNKHALQRELGLPTTPDVPLMGTVMRLVDQKGPPILFPAVREVLTSRPSQFVLLGAGQPQHEEAARQLQREFPNRVVARIGFDETLSEKVYGGIDVFLMPSMFSGLRNSLSGKSRISAPSSRIRPSVTS